MQSNFSDDIAQLKIADEFYSELNKLSDDDLKSGNFFRDEVLTGLRDICRKYGANIVPFSVWQPPQD